MKYFANGALIGLIGLFGVIVFSCGVWDGMARQQRYDAALAEHVRVETEASFQARIELEQRSASEWRHAFTSVMSRLGDAQNELATLRRNRAILQPFFESGRLAVVGNQ